MSIQAVDRAVGILSLFSNARPLLGIKDISDEMGLPRPTVHGLVQSLVENRLLIRDVKTRKYSLGLKIYELGTVLAGTIEVNRVGAAAAQRLCRETELMVRLSIWDDMAVYPTINILPSAESVRLQQFGPKVPAYASASGKAILAFSPEEFIQAYLEQVQFTVFTKNSVTNVRKLKSDLNAARKKGTAFDREEYMLGLACAASPIMDYTGRPVAAISLSGRPEFLDAGDIDLKLALLQRTALEISGMLGYNPVQAAI